MRRIGLILAALAVLMLGAILIVLFGRSAVVGAAGRVFAATPSETGEIEIILRDYEFSPKVVRVKAGQQIQLTLRNEGKHTHEFMVGRQVHVENGITEPPAPDFFEGVQVSISGTGMPMGFAGTTGMEMGASDMPMEEGESMPMEAEATVEQGMSMGQEEMQMEESMPMEAEATAEQGMPMGQEEMQKEEGRPTEEGMPMDQEEMQMGQEGMAMEEGARIVLEGAHAEGMGEMDEHHGAMVMLDPARESIITLTIPEDKVGTWVFGCFQEEGLHYDDGMHGLLIVER